MKIEFVKDSITPIERDIIVSGTPELSKEEFGEKLLQWDLAEITIEIDETVKKQMAELGLTEKDLEEEFTKLVELTRLKKASNGAANDGATKNAESRRAERPV